MRRASRHTFLVLGIVGAVSLLDGRCAADLVVMDGDKVRASEQINTRVVNHGTIAGTADDPVVFGQDSRVSGSGHFEYTFNAGTFAPGNSPGTTTGLNQAFGGTIEIELGGTTPGFGSDRHDQINDSGTFTLGPTTTLSILSYEGFVPTVGDEFEILTWQTGLDGNFGNVIIDPTFTTAGISFEQIFSNPGGPGNLTLRAVPEARVVVAWMVIAMGVVLSCAYSRWRPSSRTPISSCSPQVAQGTINDIS